jgi:hypothetical protein
MPLGFGVSRPYRFGQCAIYIRSPRNQAAIIALFRVMNRYVGNLPPMPGVFPDYPAPVERNAGGGHKLR